MPRCLEVKVLRPNPYLLFNEDCFKTFERLEDGSIDMVMVDPPYGTTACKWDSIIPLEPMWKELKRVIRLNGAIVITASQPFTSVLVCSNLKTFKYCWTWDKIKPSGFQVAKYRPMMRVEDVCVFGFGRISYFPIMTEREKLKKSKPYSSSGSSPLKYNDGLDREYRQRYPQSVLVFSNANQRGKVHPTQKPVALMEYLIKTYTNPGELVLDFAMGSGTTGVACMNLGRRFIGCDNDTEHSYFEIAKKRIQRAYYESILKELEEQVGADNTI